jgi:hypothetical protein
MVVEGIVVVEGMVVEEGMVMSCVVGMEVTYVVGVVGISVVFDIFVATIVVTNGIVELVINVVILSTAE